MGLSAGIMDFRKVQALRGPNVWANFPVLEAWVDLGEYKDRSSEEIPGFNDRLITWLPTMIEHRCSVGERGGFLQRLRRGTYLAHILEHVTIELLDIEFRTLRFLFLDNRLECFDARDRVEDVNLE